ncbi:Protein FMP32, mitochondrial [Erysiphe neolycopersici]|uniref:Protein FMP32, mitochondrial n=1 Tax=Erysiphe neolycopersici TaxID=212602 RepID=A0A420I401_9PEZI|nr:Protein FMP32, mitochondrial [Erysiphe neolycopersici]
MLNLQIMIPFEIVGFCFKPHLRSLKFGLSKQQYNLSRSNLSTGFRTKSIYHRIEPQITSTNNGFTSTKLTTNIYEQKKSNGKVTHQRVMHTTARKYRDHHFDTLRFVQRLQEEGFTEAQSVAMMKVLSDVIEESIQNLTRTMVLREEQAKATYTQKVDFAKLRTELQSSEFTESATTRASHERLTNDIAKLNSRLRDEISRTQASVRLDLNLEKGRIREEANVQELKIKETETKIEQEVAGLREKLEGVKFQTLQWLMGVCTGTAALILGAWRLLM